MNSKLNDSNNRPVHLACAIDEKDQYSKKENLKIKYLHYLGVVGTRPGKQFLCIFGLAVSHDPSGRVLHLHR